MKLCTILSAVCLPFERFNNTLANVISLFSVRVSQYIAPKRTVPLQIDITNICNLSCAHCYHAHHQNDGALSESEWKVLIDDYDSLTRELGVGRQVLVCGGEPLSSPMLMPLLSYARKLMPDAFLMVLSNGTLVKMAHAQRLRALNVAVQISLDGPDALRHDVVR